MGDMDKHAAWCIQAAITVRPLQHVRAMLGIKAPSDVQHIRSIHGIKEPPGNGWKHGKGS